MSHALPALLLGICTILGLLLVPLGLPGLWVMVAGIVGYGWLTDFRSVGVATIGAVLGLAFLGGSGVGRRGGTRGSRCGEDRAGYRDRRNRSGRRTARLSGAGKVG